MKFGNSANTARDIGEYDPKVSDPRIEGETRGRGMNKKERKKKQGIFLMP
jgi:hypothetical protein